MQLRKVDRQLESAGLRKHVTQIDGATVEYYEGGVGDTVVLLHGFGAASKWQWHKQVDALMKRHRLVIPSLLWFGGSTDTSGDFSIQRQVDILGLLLKELNENKVHLVAISYGGLIAYDYASAYPKQVDKLVLCDTPGRVYSKEDHRALLDRFQVDNMKELLLPKTRDDVRRLLNLSYYDPPPAPGFALDSVLEELYAGDGAEMTKLLDRALALLDEQSPPTPQVQAETLIIWGKHDPIFPLEIGQRLRKHIGDNATLTVFEKAKHAPNVEHPKKFNQILTDFLL